MSEDRMIEATAGPYRGQRLTLSADDAEQAISDGWAVDPFARPSPKTKPKEWDMAKVNEAAEKAARKLRGQEAEPVKKPKSETRAMSGEDDAGSGGSYKTRESTAAAPPNGKKTTTTTKK